MPSAKDFLQSSTINADAVGPKPIKCKVLKVEPQTTRDEQVKLGVQLDKFPDKWLLLNATNLKVLIDGLGDNYAKWLGQTIILKTVETTYMGDVTQGVRVALSK